MARASAASKAIELSQVIEAVKADLVESATARSDDFDPLFEIDELVVEVLVSFERRKGVKGGVQILAVHLGAEGAEVGKTVNRILVKLRPNAAAIKNAHQRRSPVARGR